MSYRISSQQRDQYVDNFMKDICQFFHTEIDINNNSLICVW